MSKTVTRYVTTDADHPPGQHLKGIWDGPPERGRRMWESGRCGARQVAVVEDDDALSHLIGSPPPAPGKAFTLTIRVEDYEPPPTDKELAERLRRCVYDNGDRGFNLLMCQAADALDGKQ